MTDPIREIKMRNGYFIRFFDHTRRYYGDFYLVKLEICAEFPLRQEYFDDIPTAEDAKSIFGDWVTYRRFIEQMGIPSTEIERVRNNIISHFEAHSLPYLESFEFPARMIRVEYEKTKKREGRGH